MTTLTRTMQLTAVVRDGRIELELPDFPDGEVIVRVERPFNPETDWTEEELEGLRQLRQHRPMSQEERNAWLDANPPHAEDWSHITDSVAWVEEQRKKRRQQSSGL